MSWEFAPEFDAAQRGALGAGKSLVYVCPPAWWTTAPLFAKLGTLGPSNGITLILAPDRATVEDGARALRSLEPLGEVHPLTGFARTTRLLARHEIATLIATAPDFIQLMRRSAIDLTSVKRIVLAWPRSQFALGSSEALDTALSQLGGVQRIVLTENEVEISDFLDRHARRAPVARAAPISEPIELTIRYAAVDSLHLSRAVRSALDILNPRSVVIWDPDQARSPTWKEMLCDSAISVNTDPPAPTDLAISVELPTRQILEKLTEVADQVLLLIRPTQVASLSSVVLKPRAFRLQSEVDLARERAAMLREQIRDTIAKHDNSGAMLTLAPLFDEYDPAVVAAALAAQRGTTSGVGAEAEYELQEAWASVRINAGRADHVRIGDIVGALLNAVGLAKDQIGKIEQRDRFSLVEVRSEAVSKALDGLNGIAIRGTSIKARLDRR